MSKNLPTGTLTFLFTDIEGSTKLWEAHPAAMQPALERHDALLRTAVADAGGVVFKTVGDAFCAAFAAAPAALEAALAAQSALLAEPWSEQTPLRVRMALHTGLAQERDDDYFGSVLNRVARLLSAGHGGQTLVSAATFELVRDYMTTSIGDRATLQDLGSHRLKDLERPEHIYQVNAPGLPAADTFPPLRTLDETPNNLPQQVTSFVGREKPLGEVAKLMGKTRLLTLTGSGGSGKTRLSLQAAADALDGFPDGAWLLELASLSDPSLVPQTVAAVLGVREQAGQTLTQTLTDFLKPQRLLLLLDNCEHLLQACAALIAALLRACPNVKVIATSREPLGIGGELTYRVPSLTLPDPRQKPTLTPESLSQYEAVRLFIERAQFVKPDFVVTNANAPALAQLCWRLDGIPLAIELAAARVRSLPVEQMVDKLDSRFRLLTWGDKAALPRQQTLRALIDWSYDLLGESEKIVLARLSIFAGGWTLGAAEAVCAGAPIEDWETLDLLTSLSDKSLVQTEEQEGASRYRMLETIRQYAAERLSASGATGVSSEAANVAVRHREFFVALAEEAEPQLTGQGQGAWLNRLETEHDNLRAALDACATGAAALAGVAALAGAAAMASGDGAETREAARAGLQLSAALWRFWQVRGYLSEGREQVARALTARHVISKARNASKDAIGNVTWAPTQKAIAAALRAGGVLAYEQGDYPVAQTFLEESLSLYREIGDKSGIACALNNRGIIASNQGDYTAAWSLYEESLSLQREVGDKLGIATSLNNLGFVAYNQGDYGSAWSLHEESLSLYREIGIKGGIAHALGNLGNVAYDQGDYAAARSLYEESLSLRREIGDKRGIAASLNNLGNVAKDQGAYAVARLLQEESLSLFREIGAKFGIAHSLEGMASVCAGEGDARQAAIFWAAAGAHRESIGAPLSPTDQVEQDAEVAKVRASLGAEAFAAAWDEGRALTWEQAVELALAK